MKHLKSKDEYEKAKEDLVKKEIELKDLKVSILNYENENLAPNFNNLDELREFLSEEPEEGTLFKYNGVEYEVLDIQDGRAKFVDLLDGGRISVILRNY